MENMWTREIFWNVGGDKKVIVYCLAAIALAFLFYGIYRRYVLWRKVSRHKRAFSFDMLGKRVRCLIVDGLLQRRILREYFPGLMHAFILWGFIILFLGTLTIALQEDITIPLMGVSFLRGYFYLFYKLTMNTVGLVAIAGILMALVRRYIIRPERLSGGAEQGLILIWILIILITGFIVEGLRIYSLKNGWEVWSIGGWMIAGILSWVSTQGAPALGAHKFMWWFHLILSLGFLAYIPFSRLIHIFTSSANIFINAPASQAVLSPIPDFTASDSYGVSTVRDFTPRQIFDLDACTQCGRCQDNCPAHISEKPLSPKKVIEELKERWLEAGQLMRGGDGRQGRRRGENGWLLGEDVIWACTLCMACAESCPVYISPFEKIMEIRRNLILMKGTFFPEIATFFRDVETFGDTFGRGRAYREDWTMGIDAKRISEGEKADILFWVGCQGTFHDRNTLIAGSLAELFKAAGADVGILGKEEYCCGDPMRRIGNEYLFQKVALRNIELLGRFNFKRIVTYCPHCFNTLKNEYPQFGARFEVLHYTELLRDLMRGGNLKITKDLEKSVAYHDPCYLARANDIHGIPREILRAVPGVKLVEPEHTRRETFCCGAGGGHMWMREIPGRKINEVRLEEIMKAQPDIITTSCPYCLIMFEDGLKSLGLEGVRCLDIAEIVRDAL
jgi:Fe-S oxidoreductase/nitrate reductase gamma subunit